MKFEKIVDHRSEYSLREVLKNKHFVKAEINWSSGDYKVDKRQPVTINKALNIIDSTGQQVFAWNIDELICTFEIPGTLTLGEQEEFDPPLTVDQVRTMTPGRYLVRYVRPRDMDPETDILSLHPNAASVGGMFLFDVKDALFTSMVKIS